MTASAYPSELAPRASRLNWRILALIAPIALIGAQAYGILSSPPDRDMGHLQKIMYVHVPAAWNAFIAFFIVFVASVRYLWTKEERHDLLAASAAEAGAVLTALTLMLGSIWGRPTWGVWWTWDARLTSTAVLLMIFVSYLALRAFTDDPERRRGHLRRAERPDRVHVGALVAHDPSGAIESKYGGPRIRMGAPAQRHRRAAAADLFCLQAVRNRTNRAARRITPR